MQVKPFVGGPESIFDRQGVPSLAKKAQSMKDKRHKTTVRGPVHQIKGPGDVSKEVKVAKQTEKGNYSGTLSRGANSYLAWAHALQLNHSWVLEQREDIFTVHLP